MSIGKFYPPPFRRTLPALAAAWLLACFVPTLARAADGPTDATQSANVTDARVPLHDNWKLQSECLFQATPEKISMPGFGTEGWHSTTVPMTVVAALVADKTYPDPYYAMNLRSIPGTDYPIGRVFSRMPMSKDSPFRCAWWYRTEFKIAPAADTNGRVWLNFGGINNRANIWLNGHQIADSNAVAGAYRTYEFDVTKFLAANGGINVLAVQTIAQTEKDLGINFVDWNPSPPDKDMGLWREVYLRQSGPVTLRYPAVFTHFTDDSLAQANLTVEAELHNATDAPVTGTLAGTIGDVKFDQPVTLQPNESRTVRFTPEQFAQLQFKNPKLWWPYQMGDQNLDTLKLCFRIGSASVSDTQSLRFGIREVTAHITDSKALQFYINGKKILIRGGGWSPDMLLRENLTYLDQHFRYVKAMGLNTIRLEGKLEIDDFYDMADQRGVLIMPGWCCCDHWEEWKKWQPGDIDIATASLRSQVLRMRAHPSIFVWLNGSDGPPPADVETAYIKVLKDLDWPNPYISSASATPTTVTGPSGVKMSGPYDYVPPDYWLIDKTHYGGAFGFNTETSPGPAPPVIDCLKKFLPEDKLWPQNEVWNYHAGGEGFKNLNHFNDSMKAQYGDAGTLDNYELKSQLMAYEGERAMFEAYSRNKYARTTGIIQWMLNNAWPSTIWHLYDFYFQPAGGYFGTKKACEPLHIMYSYDDGSIDVINSEYKKLSGLSVSATLYDIELKQRFSKQQWLDVDADAVASVFTVPADAFSPASGAFFLKLQVTGSDGKMLSSNFYWLSNDKSQYDWNKTTYQFTPVTHYVDLTALQSLPKANVQVVGSIQPSPDGPVAHVQIKNPSDHLAFQVRLAIRKSGQGGEILPVFWEDNYISLMPGETRELTAQYVPDAAVFGGVELRVTGWNVDPATIMLKEGRGVPAAGPAGGQ
ncbi:MAG: sugar-binding domain-containing protein [Candidatus Acidiferrales bacterium]